MSEFFKRFSEAFWEALNTVPDVLGALAGHATALIAGMILMASVAATWSLLFGKKRQ